MPSMSAAAVPGVRADPVAPRAETAELTTWPDTGYGTWAEPIPARVGPGAGSASSPAVRRPSPIRTGHVLTPSADSAMPERVHAP